MSKIRTRFSPSPTGFLHVGGLRTALYNYLFAKKNAGEFLLRIEDTDQSRKVAGATENILDTLNIMGLQHDGSVVHQSKRIKQYQAAASKLVSSGHAYHCFCTPKRLEQLRKQQQQKKLPSRYDGTCRSLEKQEVEKNLSKKMPFVIRQKIPLRQNITFQDEVRGTVVINSEILDDQVLIKSDGWPTYHLASVVDDHEMTITHVIRGEEWLSSTPKHILLYKFFGWKAPKFAHLPLLLNPDKSKLSKRQGDVAVGDYLDKGYLPESLLNFILLLGWNPGTEKEIFTLEQMKKSFSLKKVNKAGAVFNIEKLDWINGQYIKHMDIGALTKHALPYLQDAFGAKKESAEIKKIVALEQERIKKLSELPEAVEYFFKEPTYNKKLLLWKKQTAATTKDILSQLEDFIEGLEEKSFEQKKLEKEIFSFIQKNELGVGDVLWPMRAALSGRKASPGPFEIGEILGKKKVLERIQTAIGKL